MNSDKIPLRTHVSAAVLALNPHLFKSNDHKSHAPVSDTKPQPKPRRALERPLQGKAEGIQRIIVRITGFRCQPLDPDNFAGSTKDIIDGCRHAGLIPGDEAWRIKLETDQEKVAHRFEERTELEIIWP